MYITFNFRCQLAYVGKVEILHSSEGAGMPLPQLTELPSCAVCLERMDESVKSVLTVLCNHSFHSQERNHNLTKKNGNCVKNCLTIL